jgi:hypothetical protein
MRSIDLIISKDFEVVFEKSVDATYRSRIHSINIPVPEWVDFRISLHLNDIRIDLLHGCDTYLGKKRLEVLLEGFYTTDKIDHLFAGDVGPIVHRM